MQIRGPPRVAWPSGFVFPTAVTPISSRIRTTVFQRKNAEEFQQFFLGRDRWAAHSTIAVVLTDWD
jgi:hypothetical protein